MFVDGRLFPITRAAQNAGDASVRRNPDGSILLDASRSPESSLRVDKADDRYRIDLGGQRLLFDRHEMQRMTIDAGSREVRVGRNVDVPVRIRNDEGKEIVAGRSTPNAPVAGGKAGAIRIFDGERLRELPAANNPAASGGGWNAIGVLSSAMIGAPSAERGRAHERTLEGEWRDARSFGPGAWSLDVTAELLGGTLRC